MLEGFKKVINEKVEEGTRGAIEKLTSDFSHVIRSNSSSSVGSNYAYEQGYHDALSGKEVSLPSFVGVDYEKLLEIRGFYMKGYNEGIGYLVKEENNRKMREQVFKGVLWGLSGLVLGLCLGFGLSRKRDS